MNENIVQTYSEIYCLLKHFPESYVHKIPKKLLYIIEQNAKEKYLFEVDIDKPLEEQAISKDTKNMLVVLKYNYWSTEEEKRNMIIKLQENEDNYQKWLKEKYNTDNLFKNKKQKIEINMEEKQLVEVKEESFIQKIINKIKQFFHK